MGLVVAETAATVAKAAVRGWCWRVGRGVVVYGDGVLGGRCTVAVPVAAAGGGGAGDGGGSEGGGG